MKKLIALSLAGLGGTASANGFLLNEFDAKAVGRGNAETATDTDPSAIYYGIGGLAAGEGTQVMIGASLIAPQASFTNSADGVKTDSTTSPQYVPGIFLSSHVTDMVAVGIGFYTPFGLAVNWPDSSPQNDVVQDAALHTFFITPSVGLNLGSVVPGLAVGAGFDIVPATVELTQRIYFGADRSDPNNVGTAHLAGDAVGFGGRLGLMYRPHSQPRLSFGAMWRSKVALDMSGNADFDAPQPYRAQLPPDGKVTTTVNLPQSFSAGAGYLATPDLELELDAIWTNWSQFQNLDLNVPSSSGGSMKISQPRDYNDTFTVRLGGEYRFPHLGAALRAGFIYDPTPVPAEHETAELPDIDRYDVTLGASKSFGSYAIHGGLLWVLPGSRKTSDAMYMPEYKGTYDVSAFVASITLQGRLGSVEKKPATE
jgi:long-chain fatty acid transport protein